jgi:myo-inositol 2-dehydrogenase / D-chiro-inositol 1-dehydrogenase
MHAPLNIGLIGAGRMGQVHAQNLAHGIAGARLAAIADANTAVAEATATRLGCPAWSADPLEVIQDPAIQGVVIASPTDSHARLITAAAEAGKAIFCEKPIDRDLPATDQALDVVRRTGVPLQMGFQRRYDPAHVRSRQLVATGALGQVLFVHSHTRDPEPPPATYSAAAGGVFRDTLVHDFDALRWITGDEIVEVTARANVTAETGYTAAGTPDVASLTVRFAGGALGHIDAVRGVLYGYDVRTEIIGSAASALGGYHQETPVLEMRPDGIRYDHVFWFPQRFGVAYRDEVAAWIAAVAGGTAVTPDGGDGRQALVIALAAEESVRQGGRPVAVPAPGAPPAG